ncbi:MAG: HD domain-containing protein, partial [Solobacterium sp.]|nr:HD domain-containing protein [Solobacterium sp.]
MGKIRTDLKEYIEKNILVEYEGYEKAHNVDHIRTVIENSLEIAKEYDVNLNMVYTIAAYHDIGIRFGRDNHEITSAKWLIEDEKLDTYFTKEEKIMMKEAIEDHRASKKERPRSIYGCIVAEADRDVEPLRIVERALQFVKAHHLDKTKEEIYQITENHLKEKYGENGYLKLWIASK